ncbi:unnamed protein product [Linum tenue]|uniref:Cyclin-dependent kinase inhibitor domain-containing protein n=1 Tax=Linum tenue TaxID=586396 RepID=A0AAV0KYE3_9ROSI|nr:unnamed protein product [Linum tenue]
MGKYMKKTKSPVAMELSHSSSATSTIRTRAKTLALQRLQQSLSPPKTTTEVDDSSLSYLQLRSRRLEKPPLHSRKDPDEIGVPREGLRCKTPGSKKVRVSTEPKSSGGKIARVMEGELFGSSPPEDFGVEGSFGENCSEFETRERRSTRESTPCSLIRHSDSVGTPGSTTRQGASMVTSRRVSNDTLGNFPTTQEMDDFFASQEEQQRRLFIDKYNFDVVNDIPLPGRYEWVQVIR